MPYPAASVKQIHDMLTAKGAPFEMKVENVLGVEMRTYANAPPSLAAIFEMSRAWGDLPLAVYENERVSYKAATNAAAKLAHIFINDYGVKKGDRIALIMRNLPEWIVIFWAAVLSGAIISPLNAWWTAEELEYGLNDCGAKLVISDAASFKRVAPKIAGLKCAEHFIVARAGKNDIGATAALEALIGDSASWNAIPHQTIPEVKMLPDDIVTLFYTSGTTGSPKGAYGTHRNCITNLMNTMVAQARMYIRRGEKPPEPDPTLPRKASLMSIPLFHVTACHSVMVVSMAAGTKIVMMHKWDALKALEIIECEQITSLGGVPTIAWQILEHPQFDEFNVDSVEVVSYGGAPSAPELVKRIVEGFPNVQPGQGYGLSETSAAVTLNIGEDYRAKPTSCGPISPINDVKVIGGDGKEVALGEVGELWVKGPNVVVGYWNKPEATAEAFQNGWFKTGDLVKMDDEGFLYIVDRAKDMIIRGGENVYCAEIEDILYKHPEVFDAAIVGVPHKQLGEEVGAAISVPEGVEVTLEEIKALVGAHLASFKVPVHLKVFHEPLPRNANGKIMKRDLRELFVPN
ncbi:MAG: AMP-dependent synthetase and ligase [Hyphomonadaceae bacterium]|nr:MAG: AMP-dependent synthetase and ligase [Hyphomonadaceae bacterium]